MEAISDKEFEVYFHKYLIQKFGDKRVLDFDLETIVEALDHGRLFAEEEDDDPFAQTPPLFVYSLKDQKGILTYILFALDKLNYTFDRVEDDLICLRNSIIAGKIKGYFDETQPGEGSKQSTA